MLQQQLKQFLLYLTVEKNASPLTVASYLADIENFFEFAKLQGDSEALFDHLNHMFIRAYLGNLKARGYSPRTIARRIASLRSFFRFLIRNNVIADNPADDIHIPKAEKRPPIYLDFIEIKHLLELPASDPLGLRDVAILELLYAAGLRISELTGLAVHDIDLINRYILVYGRGAKERVVPLGRNAVRAVEIYLGQGRPNLGKKNQDLPNDKLFFNKNGGPLNERSVRRIVAKYVDRLSVTKNISPQTLRNTFAVHLLKNGADLSSVQEMLGHVNFPAHLLDMDTEKDKLRLVYKHAHPRA